MSETDLATIDPGRTNEPDTEDSPLAQAFQGPPAPPRLDITVPMSLEERESLGLQLKYEIERYLEDTLTRRNNCNQWRRDFEIYPTGRSTRWIGCADVAAPLTAVYVASHHTRLNQQIIQAIPPFAVKAKKQQAMDAAPGIEEALTAILEEAEWQDVADAVHSELPLVGNCFLRVTYETEYARVPRVQYDWDEEQWQMLVNAGVDPNEAFFHALERDDDGNPKTSLGFETVCLYAGPRMKVIPWEDGIVLPASVRDPKDARGIGERVMIRGSDLQLGAKAGKYIKDAVDKLMERPAGDPQWDYRQERLMVQGLQPNTGDRPYGSGKIDPQFEEFECFELCWQMDVDDDGNLEWVVITMHFESATILRLQYLPYEHGHPYYLMFRYFKRARELHGMAVAEKLASIQDAATSVLNQTLDHADLMLNASGNFFVDRSAGMDLDEFVFTLGQPIEVDNVEGVKPFMMTPLPSEHYQVYGMLKDMADLITASSNPSLGKTTDTSKTLGEVQIVTSASNMIFEEVAARVARTWAQVWDQIRWLVSQFGEDGEVTYRVSAAPGKQIVTNGQQTPAAMVQGQMVPAPGGVAFGTIDADLLRADVDLVPSGISQLSDMQSQTQQATIVQATLLQHPLTMQNPEVLYEALDRYLQAVRYPAREKIMSLVRQQLDQMYAQQAAMAQAQAALAGGQVPPGAPPTVPPAQPPAPEPGGAIPPLPGVAPPGAPAGIAGGIATGPGGLPMPGQADGMRNVPFGAQ